LGETAGLELRQAGAAYEIQTGIDPNGLDPDIVIRIDPDYLVDLWFDPTPDTDIDIPVDALDALTVLMHEIGHGLGFIGWSDWDTGELPGNVQSPFDDYIVFDSSGLPFFDGPNASIEYGSAVPLTAGNLFHYGNEVGPGAELAGTGLMNSVITYLGERLSISPLDLAILQDTGLDIFNPTFPSFPESISLTDNVMASDSIVIGTDVGNFDGDIWI